MSGPRLRPLERKLLRELWRLRGQVLAVAVVVASGVAVLVMALSTIEALRTTTDAYYERQRFADVFASAVRAPERVATRIADLPGVQHVATRISRFAVLDLPGFAEPVIGRLMSIPETHQPTLNRLVLRSGRWVEPGRRDEVILGEAFAEAHGLGPGDRLHALLDGHRRELRVVGTALSPEFVYSLGPGALLPDDERFGVLWLGRETLAAAYDLDQAFDDVAVSLLRGFDPEPVLARIDGLLDPYGGHSAVPRADQLSNWFVENEIAQIETLATLLPTIFLAVAAFLSHMVLGRLITTERAEIGLLKAFGYTEFEVAGYYARFVLAITLLGIVLGSILGALFGRYNTELYAEFFRFPLLLYRPSASAFAIAAGVSIAATLTGALQAVYRVLRLPPAEAMRPPAPPAYRRSRLARVLPASALDQPTRIALRQIGRWPLRAAMTSAGVALSVGLLIMALQWTDSIDRIAQSHFFDAQHQTMSIGLAQPRGESVVAAARRLPGVLRAEPWRVVPADLTHGSVTHRGSLIGVAPGSILQPIVDSTTARRVPLPEGGAVLGSFLATKLGVDVGDTIRAHLLEGRRPVREVVVADVFDTAIATPAFIRLDTLGSWLRTRPTVEYVDLLVDPREKAALFAELKELPAVTAVMLRRAAIDSFYDTLARFMLIFVAIFAGFAAALGFGVTYNSTRIALSERGRELATLRVLGFTRGEISYILLGEVALLIAVALPLGCVVGRGLATVMAESFDTELFRMPLVIDASTYGLGVLFALAATAASAALVRRKVEHLDLIRVLKTRE